MRVQFDFANGRISIEGDAPELVDILQAAREIAPKLHAVEILTQPVGPEKTPAPPGGSNGSTGGNGRSLQTMRQFVRGLSLSSAMDRITAVAYYQKVHGERLTFSPKEMGDWFTHCGLQKPSQMSVTFSDTARKKGWIENVSHGTWRITTEGENLIAGKLEAAGTTE